ncbi:MAG: hypothetical protein V4819_26345 [Verrucomicrobiota bacterium]
MSLRPTKNPFPERPIRAPGTVVRSIAIFLSGCGVILVFGGFLMWFNHAYPDRRNENLRSSPSPNGKIQAVLFRRTKLDNQGFTTHVAIIETGTELPNRSGKAFIAEGEPSVILRWIDNTHLVIDDPDSTKVILRASQVGDIQISDH